MKKVMKKKTTKTVAAKKVTAPKKTSHTHPYSHTQHLSNNMLMMLAVFFAAVALYVVLMYQKQQSDFDMYQTAHNQESLQYLARPATPAPKMMKK
jgi:formate hydrogenlyase subunit 4